MFLILRLFYLVVSVTMFFVTAFSYLSLAQAARKRLRHYQSWLIPLALANTLALIGALWQDWAMFTGLRPTVSVYILMIAPLFLSYPIGVYAAKRIFDTIRNEPEHRGEVPPPRNDVPQAGVWPPPPNDHRSGE